MCIRDSHRYIIFILYPYAYTDPEVRRNNKTIQGVNMIVIEWNRINKFNVFLSDNLRDSERFERFWTKFNSQLFLPLRLKNRKRNWILRMYTKSGNTEENILYFTGKWYLHSFKWFGRTFCKALNTHTGTQDTIIYI